MTDKAIQAESFEFSAAEQADEMEARVRAAVERGIAKGLKARAEDGRL